MPWSARVRRTFNGNAQAARLCLFIALVALVALCGGSSRPDACQLLLLRPGCILLLTVMLALPGRFAGRVARVPGLLLLAFALTILVQLLPLPPAIWLRLPGHAPYAEAAAALSLNQPWRPITLSVDLTLNSLVALAVPAALLLGGAALPADKRSATADLMIGTAALSALLGLIQITLVPSLYFYAPTDIGRPVGLFANINHQAIVLAAAIPVAAAWAVSSRRVTPIRVIIAAAASMLMLATALVTGSRSGFVLAVLAALSTPLVLGDRVPLPRRARMLAGIGLASTVVPLAAATWLAGRLGGLDRLLGGATDQRLKYLPITTRLLRDYSPFGSGFGTFDAVFRQAEPDAILKLTYFNHAHNDFLELGITGGAAAMAVAFAYLVWLTRRGVALFGTARREPTAAMGRAGIFTATLLLLGSLADYPLRAPLPAGMLALASLWVADRRRPAE